MLPACSLSRCSAAATRWARAGISCATYATKAVVALVLGAALWPARCPSLYLVSLRGVGSEGCLRTIG
jgi:hypothetical protein